MRSTMLSLRRAGVAQSRKRWRGNRRRLDRRRRRRGHLLLLAPLHAREMVERKAMRALGSGERRRGRVLVGTGRGQTNGADLPRQRTHSIHHSAVQVMSIRLYMSYSTRSSFLRCLFTRSIYDGTGLDSWESIGGVEVVHRGTCPQSLRCLLWSEISLRFSHHLKS